MLKSARILITGLLLAVCLTGFSGMEASAQTVDVTMWHAIPTQYQPLFNELLKEYLESQHNLVKVNQVHFKSESELHKKIEEGVDLPDVALVDSEWLRNISKNPKLLCIEDYVKTNIGNSVFVGFKIDFIQQMWDASLKDGKLYCLPFYAYNRALVMNEDLLAKYGIKKTPGNWAELMKAGKTVADKNAQLKEPEEWTFMIPISSSSNELADFFQVFLWQTGKDLVEPFMDGELMTVDGEEGKAVLNMLVNMVHTHKMCPIADVPPEKLVMFIATPEEYLNLTGKGRKLKVVGWPGKTASKNNLTVKSFIVFDKDDARKKEKIWNMLYHLVEFQSSLKWSLATPYLPVNKQVMLSPNYFHYLQAHPGLRVFLTHLKFSQIDNMDSKQLKAEEILGDEIREALCRRITPEEALKNATEKGNKVLDPTGTLKEKWESFSELGNLVQSLWNEDYCIR